MIKNRSAKQSKYIACFYFLLLLFTYAWFLLAFSSVRYYAYLELEANRGNGLADIENLTVIACWYLCLYNRPLFILLLPTATLALFFAPGFPKTETYTLYFIFNSICLFTWIIVTLIVVASSNNVYIGRL